MNAHDLIDSCCDQALSDPLAYKKGQNGVAVVDEVRSALKKRLEPTPGLPAAWGCMPETLTALLQLHAADAAAYQAFMVETAHPSQERVLSLTTLSGLMHLEGVLSWLSDDHEYALGGEGPQQYLTHQHLIPQWRPCVRVFDVLTALQQQPALSAAPLSTSGRRPSP